VVIIVFGSDKQDELNLFKMKLNQENAKLWIENLKEKADKVFTPPKEQGHTKTEMKTKSEVKNVSTKIVESTSNNPSNSLSKISQQNTHNNNKSNLIDFSELMKKIYPQRYSTLKESEYELEDIPTSPHIYTKIDDKHIIKDLHNNILHTPAENQNKCSNCLSKLKPYTITITSVALLWLTVMFYILYLVKIEH
jgi:hypothetical protein